MPKARPFNSEENAYVLANRESMTYEEIGRVLGRSRAAIGRQLRKLGIRQRNWIEWTKEDDATILRMRDEGAQLQEVASHLRRRPAEVRARTRELGIKRWKPFKSFADKRGYRVVGYVKTATSKKGVKAVFEHQVVMEGVIGRPLRPGEMVHHINTDKLDNRPENLHLCVGGATEHRTAHTSIEKLIPELLARGLVYFDRESATYKMNPSA